MLELFALFNMYRHPTVSTGARKPVIFQQSASYDLAGLQVCIVFPLQQDNTEDRSTLVNKNRILRKTNDDNQSGNNDRYIPYF